MVVRRVVGSRISPLLWDCLPFLVFSPTQKRANRPVPTGKWWLHVIMADQYRGIFFVFSNHNGEAGNPLCVLLVLYARYIEVSPLRQIKYNARIPTTLKISINTPWIDYVSDQIIIRLYLIILVKRRFFIHNRIIFPISQF